jgi:hypothetical protein
MEREGRRKGRGKGEGREKGREIERVDGTGRILAPHF